MPRNFTHILFFLFIITALSGVWMRTFPFIHSTIPYNHILHAHSHLAILGWAFLGVFIIFLSILWPKINDKSESIALVMILFIVSTLMFLAFIYQGYGIFSIIMSSIHIFIEYWTIIFIYRQIKKNYMLPKLSKLFINASLIFLFISSIGPFSLGFISASGLRHSDLFDMAIYFYLHFQYNGWLTLFLIGLFLIIIYKKGVKLHTKLLKIGFWIYFSAMLPWFFSSILWVELEIPSKQFATIGSIGQWIGIFFILTGIYTSLKQNKFMESKFTRFCLCLTFLLLFIKSTMDLGLISPMLADLVYYTRSVIIGYLHLTLLGFVSLFILTQFQMIKILKPNKKSITGFLIFIIGFLLNELYLFFMGFSSWLNINILPYQSEALFYASILLTVGIGIIWYSYIKPHKI